MKSLVKNEIKNWVPWKLSNSPAGSICKWLYTGNTGFTEPFFDDTISVCRRLSENCCPFSVVSDLEMMAAWGEILEDVVPAAIIFHVSRCGSTLLSQSLTLDETNIVLSEVPFFDELLRLPYKNDSVDCNMVNTFLKSAIHLYSRKRTGKEKHFFIKTDSWHIHFYKQLRELFPSIPFIFLYRNPWQVMLSQQRQRGMHSVPGLIEPEVFGFSGAQTPVADFDHYMARVLSGYLREMIEIVKADPLVLPVNYLEGIGSVLQKIYSKAGLDMSDEMKISFNERSRFHAKNPRQLFEEENKETAVPGYMSPLFQLYENLEELRLPRF